MARWVQSCFDAARYGSGVAKDEVVPRWPDRISVRRNRSRLCKGNFVSSNSKKDVGRGLNGVEVLWKMGMAYEGETWEAVSENES